MANKKVSQLTSKPSVLTTDLFPIADPSTGQLYKTTISDLGTAIGSGVSSVNSLVGAVVLDTDDIQELVSPTNKWFTDTRARAALSASSPLTYNSGTGAFGIQVATGSQNGYLSSTDWTTFNAKQAALSGTGFVKSTGGTISYDTNTYLTTSAAASTYLALAGGTMTGVLFGASASFSGYVGFGGNTSPLYQVDVTGSGRFSGDLRIESTNPRIYLTDTDNNPDYFISNTDGTFTVYDVTNSTARFTIGTTGNATFANAITGGGSITGESIYSNGIISAGSSVSATRLILTGGTSPTGLYFGHTDKVVLANYTIGGGIDFETNGGNITMQLSSGGVLSTTGGASFSGALSGTSASFSSTLTAVGTTIKNPSVDGSIPLISIKDTSDVYQIGYLNFNQSTDLMTLMNKQGYSASGIAFGTNNIERVRISVGGNVGIGTTSPSDYSGYTTLHLNGKSGANGGVLRLTAYDSTSSANIYAGGSALNINTTSAVPIKFLTRDTTRMQILDSGAIIAGNLMGNQYSMTSGSGTGTAIVDTGITYNTGDYGGYGRGVTYEVVFNGNPNGNGSAAYFAQYMGILIIYTGWSGSAVTTYIQYTQLAGGNNIGALTLTPVFWNGSTESSSIGVYTTGAQIRLKISGYNSGATGQDQSVYLRRIS